MPLDQIVIQSAGSLAVALLALMMVALQLALALRRPKFALYAWSAAISFSAFIYAVGVFIEYNFPPGPVNQTAGKLEWTAVVFLVHSLSGVTFALLRVDARRYHVTAGIFHGLLLILLWFTDRLVSDQFAARHFIGMTRPYVEAALGPWGWLFILYATMASIGIILYGIQHDHSQRRFNRPYLAGFILWIGLGLHDGLAALDVVTVQYLMEYGFLIFAMVVLWVVFTKNDEAASEGKYRMITELANDGIFVIQNGAGHLQQPGLQHVPGPSGE